MTKCDKKKKLIQSLFYKIVGFSEGWPLLRMATYGGNIVQSFQSQEVFFCTESVYCNMSKAMN